MPSLFAITTAANRVPLDGNRKGQIIFTVSNTSVRAVRGRARIAPDGSAAATWFTLAGGAERDFSVNGTQQYTVQITVPPTVAAGNYTVRLDMVGVDNPDEDYTQGPSVTFAVPEPLPVKKPFPWWIIAVIAGIVIVGIILSCCVIAEASGSANTGGQSLNRGAANAGSGWIESECGSGNSGERKGEHRVGAGSIGWSKGPERIGCHAHGWRL